MTGLSTMTLYYAALQAAVRIGKYAQFPSDVNPKIDRQYHKFTVALHKRLTELEQENATLRDQYDHLHKWVGENCLGGEED